MLIMFNVLIGGEKIEQEPSEVFLSYKSPLSSNYSKNLHLFTYPCRKIPSAGPLSVLHTDIPEPRNALAGIGDRSRIQPLPIWDATVQLTP